MALARWPFTFEPSFLHPHFNSQSLISIFVIVILSMYNSLRLIITSQRTNYWRSIISGWFVACAQLWARDTGDGRWRRFILQVIMVIIMVTIMVIIIAIIMVISHSHEQQSPRSCHWPQRTTRRQVLPAYRGLVWLDRALPAAQVVFVFVFVFIFVLVFVFVFVFALPVTQRLWHTYARPSCCPSGRSFSGALSIMFHEKIVWVLLKRLDVTLVLFLPQV